MNLSCHLSTTNDFLFQIAVVIVVCSLAWRRPRFHSSLITAIDNEQSKWSTTSERERKYTALFVSGEYYHVNCISIFSGKAPPSATFTIPCGFNFLTFVQESFQGVRDRGSVCMKEEEVVAHLPRQCQFINSEREWNDSLLGFGGSRVLLREL